MAENYRVILSPEALKDLEGIYEWVAKDSADAGARVVTRLLDEIESLDTFPQRYAKIETRRSLPWPIRRMPSPPYRILYWIEERSQAVRVLAVRHGRQRPWP